MMFKQGDKLECINDGILEGSSVEGQLTAGKVYIAAKDQTSSDNISVADDAGFVRGVFPQRFKLVQPAIDLTKQLETVSGEPVAILSTEGRGTFPVLAYVGERDYVMTFNNEGHPASNHPAFVLRNVKPKPLEREVYAPVYVDFEGKLMLGPGYSTRESLERCAGSHRVGTVKVKLVEGQFAE